MRKATSIHKDKVIPAPNATLPNYKEFLWYQHNEDLLLNQYFGRFIVIKDEKVLGDFASKAEAWLATIKNHLPGSFIIHHCVPVDAKRLPRLANRQFVMVHA